MMRSPVQSPSLGICVNELVCIESRDGEKYLMLITVASVVVLTIAIAQSANKVDVEEEPFILSHALVFVCGRPHGWVWRGKYVYRTEGPGLLSRNPGKIRSE